MSGPSKREQAEIEAREARERLTATLVDLQRRLNPKALAQEAIEEIRETGAEIGRAALASARRNPGPLIGITATLLAFFARHWIADAFGSFEATRQSTEDRILEGTGHD